MALCSHVAPPLPKDSNQTIGPGLAGFLRFFLSELVVTLKEDGTCISFCSNGYVTLMAPAYLDRVLHASMYLRHHLEYLLACTGIARRKLSLLDFVNSKCQLEI
jgi:hypothetical protein